MSQDRRELTDGVFGGDDLPHPGEPGDAGGDVHRRAE
jgi:hypothetical protein